LIVLAMTAACGAFAQVYKSIGPDGKVIYSDKPPADSDAKPTAIAAPPKLSPPSAPADAPSAPADAPVKQPPKTWAEKKAAAVSPIRVDPARAKQPVQSEVDPAVEKAVIAVLALEDLAMQTEALCLRTLPTSFKRYSTVDGWRQRNAAILARAKLVLAEAFIPADRQLIETGVKGRNVQTLAPVVAAPTASRIKWCDESADEISSGRMDPNRKENLSTPLMSYKPKSG
jgi:hypothetical protein